MTDLMAFSEEIANLLRLELPAPRELWNTGVLKSERQPLVVKKPWAGLKLIMQVWPECVPRVPQPSKYLAGGDPFAYFDPD